MIPSLVFFVVVAQPVPDAREERVRQLIAEIAASGRVLVETKTEQRLADPKRLIAPGAPPLLSFRYFNGLDRHRFGQLDLMLDDAGH